MTEIAQDQDVAAPGAETAAQRRIRKRYAQNLRLQAYGVAAIGFAVLMLGILLVSMVSSGYLAFTQTHVTYDLELPSDAIDPGDIRDADWDEIVEQPFFALLSGLDTEVRAQRRAASAILSDGASLSVREMVRNDPSLIGRTVTVTVPLADEFDQLEKGLVHRDTPEEYRLVSDQQIVWFDQLKQERRISSPFNTALFLNANSRHPELAGLKGALLGSLYALIVCFALSFPIGIATAVYLEEFAPKNRWTDLIEVNINNLAAVPSIVFGLLGLAVFIGFFGLPRSVPLVGGMVLSLMTLPTIIIATRAALKSVPPSIREAALGVGASPLQVVMHHVLPLAMPGIMTGTIIGMAQALGETAPLLLIGMNAFITAAPDGLMDASTALPTQIFIWADSPERGFTTRTSAAILVLLGFMIIMNGTAVLLRRRLERKW